MEKDKVNAPQPPSLSTIFCCMDGCMQNLYYFKASNTYSCPAHGDFQSVLVPIKRTGLYFQGSNK
jgi:hypothetical protein